MEREIIQYDSKGQHPSNWSEFEIVRETIDYFHSKQNCVDIEMVLRRKADKKFFDVDFINHGEGKTSFEINPIAELKEVFPKKIEITVYE